MTSANILQHDCTIWRQSSQAAANLYSRGVKLWTKSDFLNIEDQLELSKTQRHFTVRRIDGSTQAIANPMFNIESPIWEPRVKFREYWRLVKEQPDDPEETYLCSYLPRWINTSARSFRGVVADAGLLYEMNKSAWISSHSLNLLRSQLAQMPAIQRVKKIVCFGLGDICRKPPEWVRRHASSNDHDVEANFVRGAMIQHAVASSMTQMCRDLSGYHVDLLAQDPDYTDEAREILTNNGFTIVGDFGAGGFAEITDETLVFSVLVEAPLKQIIADIARPAVIISTGFDVFNDSEKPWADAESPRTVQMWRDYEEKISFPISDGDEEAMSKFKDLYIYAKKD